jgi:CheY-like chemotaxis protein
MSIMSHTLRVLLVEDTFIAQKVQMVQMTQQGCIVDLAEDGFIALEKAKNNHYDLILMDIGLGDGPDGFEVTSSIKTQDGINKETIIVAVTSHGGAEYMQKAMDVGMADYFNKPFSPDDAKKIVEFTKNKLGLS